MTQKKTFYLLIFLALITAYAWLLFVIEVRTTKASSICILKFTTGIPCPACGSTRAVLLIINGNLQAAFFMNPLGFLFTLFILIVPIFLFVDMIFKKEKLWHLYHRAEIYLKKKSVLIAVFSLIALNWIWNILKGL